MSTSQVFVYLDLVLVLILAFYGYRGYKRMFFKEFVGFIGFMLAFTAGLTALPLLAPKLVTASQLTFGASLVAVFLLVFGFVRVAYHYLEKLIHENTKFEMPERFDRLLGTAIGLVKGLLIVSLLAIFLKLIYISDNLSQQVKNSNFLRYAEGAGPAVYDRLRSAFPGAKKFVNYIEEAAGQTPPRLVDEYTINVLIDLDSEKADQWTSSTVEK